MEFFKNLSEFVSENMINVFFLILGSAILIKITSALIKFILTIAVLILFGRLILNMGIF